MGAWPSYSGARLPSLHLEENKDITAQLRLEIDQLFLSVLAFYIIRKYISTFPPTAQQDDIFLAVGKKLVTHTL